MKASDVKPSIDSKPKCPDCIEKDSKILELQQNVLDLNSHINKLKVDLDCGEYQRDKESMSNLNIDCKNFKAHNGLIPDCSICDNYESKNEGACSVTLFKCFYQGGKTEVQIEKRNVEYMIDRDNEASYAFRNDYCAIIVEHEGKKSRRYCWEIEDILRFSFKNSWNDHLSINNIDYIVSNILRAANDPRWIIESHGMLYKAYQLKSGQIALEMTGSPILLFDRESPFLKAIKFIPQYAVPYCLHGRD